jgi:hypothetical protein
LDPEKTIWRSVQATRYFIRKNKDYLYRRGFTAQKQMHGYAYVLREITASDDRTNNDNVTSDNVFVNMRNRIINIATSS